MDNPNFISALLYLLIAALLGALMPWLWMRLRIQDLQDLLKRKGLELETQEDAYLKLQQETDNQGDGQTSLRDQLAILKQAEVQWKASEKNHAAEKKALQKWREKAKQLEEELKELRARLTEDAIVDDGQDSPSKWELKLEKSEKARKELQMELDEAAKREAKWHKEISAMAIKIQHLKEKLAKYHAGGIVDGEDDDVDDFAATNVTTPINGDAESEAETEEEKATLARIRERAKELNFERIGTASENEKDDLRKIKGIGPFSEKKLNSIGIFTYAQLSRLQSEDVDKLNEVIEFFPGRIKRDNWVDQAQKLSKQKASS
jgi:predicted flap endonuclease-1-like 5' DNA nuclease